MPMIYLLRIENDDHTVDATLHGSLEQAEAYVISYDEAPERETLRDNYEIYAVEADHDLSTPRKARLLSSEG